MVLPLAWVALLLAGFSLMHLAGNQPIVDANRPGTVTTLATIAYAAGGLAGAGFTARTGFWELVNNLSAPTGLALFTLAVTFVLRVVTADAHARAAAWNLAGLGSDPYEVVSNALTESSGDTLSQWRRDRPGRRGAGNSSPCLPGQPSRPPHHLTSATTDRAQRGVTRRRRRHRHACASPARPGEVAATARPVPHLGPACPRTPLATHCRVERVRRVGGLTEQLIGPDTAVLTIRNDGELPHTFTAPDGAFDLYLNPGEAGTVDVPDSLVNPVYCTLHGTSRGQGMSGVVVRAGSDVIGASATRAPSLEPQNALDADRVGASTGDNGGRSLSIVALAVALAAAVLTVATTGDLVARRRQSDAPR